MQREHLYFAEWPRNPQTFLPAGTSHAAHNNTHRINFLDEKPWTLSWIPLQKSKSSFTSGSKYVLMSREGSRGPGMIPTSITFCRLYHKCRGRFMTVR